MLFLYRPRQTWMPYARVRQRTAQADYNRTLQARYRATLRVTRPELPSDAFSHIAAQDPIAQLRDLAALHESGALNDQEFTAAKARVLRVEDESP
jgi:hypothetical protein